MKGGRAMPVDGIAGGAMGAVPGSEGQGSLGVERWTLDEMRGPRGRLP